jgi:hypothetical protein
VLSERGERCAQFPIVCHPAFGPRSACGCRGYVCYLLAAFNPGGRALPGPSFMWEPARCWSRTGAPNSQATVKLISKTFDVLKADPNTGRAAALPIYDGSDRGGRLLCPSSNWAPFVVVGESGARYGTAIIPAQGPPSTLAAKAVTAAIPIAYLSDSAGLRRVCDPMGGRYLLATSLNRRKVSICSSNRWTRYIG